MSGLVWANTGSSPRVRGILEDRLGFRRRGRIIPACAGNTWQGQPQTTTSQDHPRVCGEYWRALCPLLALPGSSPRVRGIRDAHGIAVAGAGIIPSCAGNTRSPHWRRKSRADHPRVCGEYLLRTMWDRRNWGSSPRVRGIHVQCAGHTDTHRIIPACAGNTNTRCSARLVSTDHPRVCGEYAGRHTPLARPGGSSPRVRGILASLTLRPRARRIIPACAGNTWRRGCRCIWSADHPRVCGEYRPSSIERWVGMGSSPRVRGIPLVAGRS